MRGGRLLLITYLLLAVWSLLLVYSTSYGVAIMRYKVEPSYFFNRQLLFYGLGILGLLICSRLNVKLFYHRYTLRILAGTLLGLLALVLVTGSATNNAQRWLSILGVTFQPTEMVKLLLILVMATVLMKKGCGQRVQYWLLGFVFLTVALVFLQPDLGTALILGIIGVAVFLTSGVGLSRLVRVAIGVFIFVLFAAVIIYLFHPDFFSSAKLGRFAYLDPFNTDNLDASYQLRNGYFAIGSGGIFGNGLGGSIQKLGYLPEPHTDFIMTIIAEELGVFGVIWTIFLLMLLVFTTLYIGVRSPFIFDSLVCIGVATWISVQTFLNLGGVSGIIPLTGVPLPFISYGGSSVIMLSCAVGFVLAAARRNGLAKARKVVYL
ncbi:FtsW/RodA/SpoVE family cell cycle protein [Listeria seeligeri]|uniref:FtsW/RodA/SpoVE family cell cycle protein n=1 Tax=Listeria seeligeri TaxID=1640 RepID=UPI00162390DF|nr:FtsW/RodA/SpoVE family cell cycle protein [Listeria seeligeri]MBC1420312.1 FtsW/RodA/SpoVE family cell cycle protein [Listeria seeligeri]MBC1527351.1 FtsW/RodA/SpoVE family cell cycle protein [Listeria seeligeri]MBC1750016.1 FtsW/RodA/SpoVE family cell cycle protein [Listeria seeligeri]MBC1828658.1 FtsW/RodA/SpoVE family cell cycle protein [Listeria seeligeri]MBC1844872.1 FtsW/RodA/SpoVE family cell cycle protein [Listeria seeligeri]